MSLQGAALCHIDMSAGSPWHDAAPSGMDKCRVSAKAVNILGSWFRGFFKFCWMLTTYQLLPEFKQGKLDCAKQVNGLACVSQTQK